MQGWRRYGVQSLSGSTGIGDFFAGTDGDGGAALMASELIGAVASGVAFGFAAVASLAAGGVTAGAEITVFGAALVAGGSGFAAG